MTLSTMRLHILYRYRYTLFGLALGLGAPAGWFLWRFLYTQRDHFIPWSMSEVFRAADLYFYLTVMSVLMFSFFGYILGIRMDSLRQDSQSIKSSLMKVTTQAITDGLTGLHNQRAIHENVSIELESAQRYETPLTCILFDIDHFKSINDTYGHPFGDEVLIQVARTTKLLLRRVDYAGRFGGEEFLVVMPHTNLAAGYRVAERLRIAIEKINFEYEGQRVLVSISVGVATFPTKNINSKTSLLKAVDEALYQAKNGGRNRTVCWGQPRANRTQEKETAEA